MEVLIWFLMANSDNFELKEFSAAASSSALFLRRSSKVEMDRADCGVDESPPVSLDSEEGISWCLLRFVGANPECRHPA